MSTYCKYYKEKKQVSYDNGITYVDVVPAEYRKGELIEIGSADCVIAPSGYSTHFLTLVPLENGEFTFDVFSGATGTYYIYYSMDSGSTWNTLTLSTASTASIQVTSGNKVMLKGNGYTGYAYLLINSTCYYNVEGNILSLDYGDNFTGQTSVPSNLHTHHNLFSGSTQLISAENLILPYYFASDDRGYGFANGMFKDCTSLTTAPITLPATTLVDACYNGMFQNCTSLTTAPVLPATDLAIMCYNNMFAGCTSLITAPALPATTLATSCYVGMFQNCTSLATAPELPATTLADTCYYNMFNGCTSLNYVKCLATNIPSVYCTYDWLSNVASSGTFVKASSMSGWERSGNGIPSNWSVQNA
ncbi:MAG: leucine-rich repeat protein [Methanobrevibacter sp.]|nr:leucine-rich repeat protein [Methanobrevibacter sp.]